MEHTILVIETTTNGNSTERGVNPTIEDGHDDGHVASVADLAPSNGSEIELSNQNPGEDYSENVSLLPAMDTRNEIDGDRSSSNSESVSSIINKYLSKNSLLLTGSIFIAGSTYTSVFNVNHSYAVPTQPFSVRDIILNPDGLLNAFYSLVFMTVAFTVSMVGVLVPLWSVIKKCSFCYRPLSLLGMGAFFASYTFSLKENVPKFWVTVESYDFFKFQISSFCLVWLFGLSLILALLVIFFVAKLILALLAMIGPVICSI